MTSSAVHSGVSSERLDRVRRVAGCCLFAGALVAIAACTSRTPGSPSPVGGFPPFDSTAFEDQVIALVNARRAAGARCGDEFFPPVAPLTLDVRLQASARDHSADMAAHDYFGHTSLDGRTFDRRIEQAGYAGAYPWGENVAAGQPTPEVVVDGWMSSPGHCENIMSPDYRATGVGYARRSGTTYGHYWTEDFGGS